MGISKNILLRAVLAAACGTALILQGCGDKSKSKSKTPRAHKDKRTPVSPRQQNGGRSPGELNRRQNPNQNRPTEARLRS